LTKNLRGAFKVFKPPSLSPSLSLSPPRSPSLPQTYVHTEESIAAEKTLTVAGKLLDYILVEKNDEASETLWCVFASGNNKGFYGSVFGLGPANTMYVPLCISVFSLPSVSVH
jgi:hypothetical protein